MTSRAPLLPYVTFEADPPELPVRQRGDRGGPEYIVTASVLAEEAHGLRLAGTTQHGTDLTITVSVVAPGVVRVWLAGEDADPHRVTLAREVPAPPDVTVEKTTGRYTLQADPVTAQVDLDPFHLTFYGPDGRVLLDQNATDSDVTDRLYTLPLGFSQVNGQRAAFHDSFTAQPDEHFYGFGEKFTDFDKRGQRLKMWHREAYGVHCEWAYKNVPFFLSSRGYGLFVDSTSPVEFDMGHSNHATFSLIVPDSALDYYVIVGPEPKAVITRYASLVSFPILPPKWAFGLWMSSGFKADSADDVLARAGELRENGVPCDVLHLDCYWQKHGRWSDLQWDADVFPDPERLLRQVKAQHFKVCLWINPYIGVESPLFEEARSQGYLLKTTDGETWVGDLWGGEGQFHPPVGIIDVTNPGAVAWFKDLLRAPLRLGADVYKTDFGEGVPPDTVAHNGLTGVRLHNLYPLLYNDIVAEVTREVTGGPGLVWGRSTYAGGQRHAAQWGGDPNCTYQGMASTLRGGLSLGVCGHAFWSHDIGGFHRQPTPELYVRWAQFGLLSPLARAHGMTTRLPWDYGEDALRLFRQYVKLRYRLLPYIYTYAVIAHETSLPLLRAMVLEFPDDPCTYTMDLQYMFGAELMVAPVYNREGRRPVYFPAGRWVDYWTHEVIEGPGTRHLTAPLDRLPLYVRANALIPTIEPPPYLTDDPFELVTFDGYLLDGGSFELRDTDGITTFSASFVGSQVNVQVEGAKRRLGLRLLPLAGRPAVHAVRVNGRALSRVGALDIDLSSEPGWTRDDNGTVRMVIG